MAGFISVQVIKGRGTALKYKKFIGNFPKTTARGRDRLAQRVQRRARENVENRTIYHGKNPGQLAESIKIFRRRAANSAIGDVRAMTPYAQYVESGTMPHFIPFGLGRLQGVDHPGATPMFFMRDAANQVKQEAKGIINAVVGRARKEAGLK